MANAGGNPLHQQLDRLFQSGTVAGLSDSELLERYLTRRDEVAFEALVRLHGPMVLGLCRRLLHDRQEVEDAFQATFLILVRKAPTLRDRTLLANWLYGVAYRVAIRARKKSGRRNAGKQPSELLDEIASNRTENSDIADWMPILDQELTRLPEKFRGPLVLCYLNGQTHEQSAGQLGIPIGTVRSRLARGRDLLKRRLERRGVAPSVVAIAMGPSSSSTFLATVPTTLVHLTLMSANRFLSMASTSTAMATATISAISLAQGVITSMFLSQAKVAALGLLATAVVAGGGVWVVKAQPGAQGEPKPAQVSVPTDVGKAQSELRKVSGKAPTEVTKGPTRQGSVPELLSELDPGIPVEAHVLTLETKIKELEAKLNRLASQPPRQPPKAEDERSRRAAPMLDLTGFQAPAGMSLPELEAEIKILKRRLALDRELIKFEQVSHREHIEGRLREILAANRQFDETGSSIQRLIAKLERLKQSLEEEVETLMYQRSRKQAEMRVERSNVEVALSKVERNSRLNQRIKGAVSDEDMAKDNSVFQYATAQEAVVKADLDFLKARIENLSFPGKKIAELLTEAKAIDLSLEPKPATTTK